ncbi:MAG: hypothetical protein ABW185_23220 [Sedimenticola sp.]
MFEIVKRSVRRARNSSSDSEPGTPAKYHKMADNSDALSPGSSNPKSIDDLYEVLKDIRKDNKETRTYMERRLDKFSNDMKSLINTSVTSLRSDMQNEFTRVDSLIESMSDKIKTIEISAPGATAGPRSDFDTSRNLCFKNLKEDENESLESLKVYVENVLDSVKVKVKVVCVKRVGVQRPEFANNNQNRLHRPTIVTLESVEQTHDVMRSKRGLRDSDQFSRIYIERDKTRSERILEANIRALANKVPGLRVRGGRVLTQ